MNKKQAILFIFLLILSIFLLQFLVHPDISFEKSNSNPQQSTKLIRVVDGDTLVVSINGEQEKIRIIGLDTPESVKSNHPIECFAKEATEHITELLSSNSTLSIVSDPSQDTRDKYGRMLAHIFVGEVNIAQQMIVDGYAYEYTYRTPYIYQSEYRNAQLEAKEYERGLWSPQTCNGNR